jgi:hypothetical protein
MFESILIGTPKHRPFKRLSKLPKGYRGTLESSPELTSVVLALVANPGIDLRTQGGRGHVIP